MVELSCDESFQASDDVPFGEAFGGSSLHVGDGGWVPSHADDDHAVEGGVGLAVSTAVEAVTAAGFAGTCGYRAGAAQFGERGLGADSVCVITGNDEHLGGGVEPDTESFQHLGSGGSREFFEVVAVGLDLFVEVQVAACK